MATESVSGAGRVANSALSTAGSTRDVGEDDFLNLLIAELQNQDPLNPTDNGQILEQISQIRSIETTTKLNETLQSVLLGQNLASASGLIEKQVRGLSDDGQEVSGQVDRVAIEDGVPRLIVGATSLRMSNLREVLGGKAA